MKICAALLGLLLFPLAASAQSGGNQPGVAGRTTYYPDDSRTESVRDMNTREMTETTYNPAGQLTVKKVFLLNEKGETLQGNVYDGRGNLVARCQCIYDELGRRKEDRLINMQGQVFQQVIHEYGVDGKALQPKVINLDPSARPTIRPQSVDFTGAAPTMTPSQPGAAETMGGGNSSRFAPQQVPSGSPTAPQNPAQTAPSETDKAKPNFFKKLFKKKE